MNIHIKTPITIHRSALLALSDNCAACYYCDDALRPTRLIAEIGHTDRTIDGLRFFLIDKPIELTPGTYALTINGVYAQLHRIN